MQAALSQYRQSLMFACLCLHALGQSFLGFAVAAAYNSVTVTFMTTPVHHAVNQSTAITALSHSTASCCSQSYYRTVLTCAVMRG